MGLEWPHERHIKMSIEYVPWLLFCIARTEIFTAFAERVHISHGSAPNAPSGRCSPAAEVAIGGRHRSHGTTYYISILCPMSSTVCREIEKLQIH